MNREILFRGKTVDNAKWVYGNLIIDTYDEPDNIEKSYRIVNRVCGVYKGYITHESWINEKINQSTIGQYTGLTDRNGKRIFEGDILLYTNPERETSTYYVLWKYNRWLIQTCDERDITPDDLDEGFCADAEVIGNIHDNPELLERGRE